VTEPELWSLEVCDQRDRATRATLRIANEAGPGGVLWGSNSLLGILNVITKDAEDVEGVEVGGGLGQGDGDVARRGAGRQSEQRPSARGARRSGGTSLPCGR
jgi:outer membrane receptor protein involved in Fe transport